MIANEARGQSQRLLIALRAASVASASFGAALMGACAESNEFAAVEEGSDSGAWPIRLSVEALPKPEFERVVLVTIDTLRADHLSCYGYRRETTPFLDSLAQRGVLFENATASVSHTAPSHASILTGLPPIVHGVLRNGEALDPSARDMAAMFGVAGYETACVVNTAFLEAVATNFDFVASEKHGSQNVINAAIEWLEHTRQSDRFFLWVHLFDPHQWLLDVKRARQGAEKIRATAQFNDREFFDYIADLHGLPQPEPNEPFTFEWQTTLSPTVESRRDFLDLIDFYDALIQYSDRQVSRLYDALAEQDLDGRTLWIVTADHGEGVGSHGNAGHGGFVFQEQLHVPLILHASDDSLGPARVSEVVQHMDLFRTVAETLGIGITGASRTLYGTSLWPLIRDDGTWTPRTAFSQRRPRTVRAEELQLADEESWVAVYALRNEELKYVLRRTSDDECYDLAADPREQANIYNPDSAQQAALLQELEARIADYMSQRRSAYRTDISDQVLEELRALGYVE